MELYGLILFLFVLFPALALADCSCDTGDDGGSNKPQATKYKLAAIASILVAGATGVCIPILGKKIAWLQPEKPFFILLKAFAAGVILATGFIHVLPDAFESLTSQCLSEHPWGDFPFTGFVAMMAAIATLIMDSAATSYFSRMAPNPETDEGIELEDLVVEGLVESHAQLLRYRVVSKVLELGIVVHSVIIGVSLGASQSPTTIRPLVGALAFHQLFEGMGLGGCIAQARESRLMTITMVIFFSLTTPVGIWIGILISSVYQENSPTALIMEGVLNAASAGILLYMALVDLLAAEFMNPKLHEKVKLHIGASISLLLGAGGMSLIAKWA